MSERPRPPAPSGRLDEAPPAPADDERATWTHEDDELLLLDEIDESPDDELIDDLV